PPGPPPARTGLVFVRTIPSGGTVSANNQRLQAVGGAYPLPVGKHLLVLKSPVSDETHRVAIEVSEGERVTLCYDFDANRACSQ
ncbi:MAG: hypothetical protein ABMA64_23660, partial [Myxococcota bacterium]